MQLHQSGNLARCKCIGLVDRFAGVSNQMKNDSSIDDKMFKFLNTTKQVKCEQNNVMNKPKKNWTHQAKQLASNT